MALIIKANEVSVADLLATKNLLQDPQLGQQLPAVARQLLDKLIESVEQGNVLCVLEGEELLTTTQAAKMLGVSRPYISGLIKRGVLASQRVGTHHRIELDHVMELKQSRDALEEMRRCGYSEGFPA